MKLVSKKKFFYLILILFIAWLAGSIYWYSCEFKKVCTETKTESTATISKITEIEKNKIENKKIVKNKITEKEIRCQSFLNQNIIYQGRNSGTEVKKLENFLTKIYPDEKIKIDGYYGKKDWELIKEFQEKNQNSDFGKIKKIDGNIKGNTLKIINIENCIIKAKELVKNNK